MADPTTRADRILAILAECRTSTEVFETWQGVVATLPMLANHGYQLREDLVKARTDYPEWKRRWKNDDHMAGKWLVEALDDAVAAYQARLVDARDRTVAWVRAAARPAREEVPRG